MCKNAFKSAMDSKFGGFPGQGAISVYLSVYRCQESACLSVHGEIGIWPDGRSSLAPQPVVHSTFWASFVVPVHLSHVVKVWTLEGGGDGSFASFTKLLCSN